MNNGEEQKESGGGLVQHLALRNQTDAKLFVFVDELCSRRIEVVVPAFFLILWENCELGVS